MPKEIRNLGNPITPIRIIKRKSFMRRLTTNEFRTLRNSTNEDIIDIREFLMMERYIDLSDPDLATDLITAGMNQERVDELLVDGTESEKYRGDV